MRKMLGRNFQGLEADNQCLVIIVFKGLQPIFKALHMDQNFNIISVIYGWNTSFNIL